METLGRLLQKMCLVDQQMVSKTGRFYLPSVVSHVWICIKLSKDSDFELLSKLWLQHSNTNKEETEW